MLHQATLLHRVQIRVGGVSLICNPVKKCHSLLQSFLPGEVMLCWGLCRYYYQRLQNRGGKVYTSGLCHSGSEGKGEPLCTSPAPLTHAGMGKSSVSQQGRAHLSRGPTCPSAGTTAFPKEVTKIGFHRR